MPTGIRASRTSTDAPDRWSEQREPGGISGSGRRPVAADPIVALATAGDATRSKELRMTITEHQPGVGRIDDSPAVRPFTVRFPESDLDDLHRRVRETRWPDRETVRDASQGVQLQIMQ